jgi:putative transposase
MIAAIRGGQSQRSVARSFGLALSTVQYWVRRVGLQPLDQVDWSDRTKAAHTIANKTRASLENRICALRAELHKTGALGFVGAEAIREALLPHKTQEPLPSVRTIGRILRRNGLLDRLARVRRPAPPAGWYLPAVAQGVAELDTFDVIEDLRLEAFGLVQVFTARSLWNPLAGAWPAQVASTSFILEALQAHWRNHGLPCYAQFDNDVRFQGGHNHPDVVGRVMRLCLSLGVAPVFAPPLEMGFQGVIENFNGLWQQKVWTRFHHEHLAALARASNRFI